MCDEGNRGERKRGLGEFFAGGWTFIAGSVVGVAAWRLGCEWGTVGAGVSTGWTLAFLAGCGGPWTFSAQGTDRTIPSGSGAGKGRVLRFAGRVALLVACAIAVEAYAPLLLHAWAPRIVAEHPEVAGLAVCWVWLGATFACLWRREQIHQAGHGGDSTEEDGGENRGGRR